MGQHWGYGHDCCGHNQVSPAYDMGNEMCWDGGMVAGASTGNNSSWFVLIVVLFILLIIVGKCYM